MRCLERRRNADGVQAGCAGVGEGRMQVLCKLVDISRGDGGYEVSVQCGSADLGEEAIEVAC